MLLWVPTPPFRGFHSGARPRAAAGPGGAGSSPPSPPLRSPPASAHARGRSPGDTAPRAPRAAPRPPRAPRAGGAIFKRLPAGGRRAQGEPRGGCGERQGR